MVEAVKRNFVPSGHLPSTKNVIQSINKDFCFFFINYLFVILTIKSDLYSWADKLQIPGGGGGATIWTRAILPSPQLRASQRGGNIDS